MSYISELKFIFYAGISFGLIRGFSCLNASMLYISSGRHHTSTKWAHGTMPKRNRKLWA